MSIASLAQGARQSLARGLEALQAKDAPIGLMDVAQPVARAIGALVDLELSPDELTADGMEAVLEALREALRLLQAPEHVQHPAAARGMKAVAEALAVAMMLARFAREGARPANDLSPARAASRGARDAARSAPPAAPPRSGAAQERAPSPASAPAPRTAAAIESTLMGGPVPSTPAVPSTPSLPSAPPRTAAAIESTLMGGPAPSAPPAPSWSGGESAPSAGAAQGRAGAAIESTLMAGSAPPPAASSRPSLRALAMAAPSAEPAVVTRAVNAVMGPAPASMRREAAASAEVAPALRAEPAAPPALSPPEPSPPPPPPEAAPVPHAPGASSVRSEPAPSRPEPPLPALEPGRFPEPPPLISTRPIQIVDSTTSAPSRPPASIRRDVIAEHDLRTVDAPLGAHSPSNFYLGLGGSDVVASGGLFVATYQVPKVGEKVLLKISMPGGYEFLAKAKVAWTRDVATSLAPGSPRGMPGAPGFGAQLCEVTEEGRRLIQRYVRNREPLVHEDSS